MYPFKERENYIFKKKCILWTSIFLLLISIGLYADDGLSYDNNFEITSIDIREMATASIAIKVGKVEKNKKLIEVEPETEERNDSQSNPTVQRVSQIERIWYLPTEYGIITTYPNYYHVAYDITSPRGSAEIIYPVARGTISNIYYDNAGAKIVTVRHFIDGKYYSSQYVHLSNFANIYVGQEVDPFTPLGWMGTTGISTGVHLHIAFLDCNMFGNTDMCSDLNGFFNYGKIRFNQGFYGLSEVIDVPYSWNGTR